MKLNPKVQQALEALETARADLVEVLRSIRCVDPRAMRTKRKRARRSAKPTKKRAA